MRKRINYSLGDKIGNCIYLKEVEPIIFNITETNKIKTIKRKALFKCSCGKEFEAMVLAVKSGNTKSCGCLSIKKARVMGLSNKTHGFRKHPLYKMWQGMIRRCNNPKDFAYYNYGGRGIKVCNRWKDINFFIEDMYSSYNIGLELDRIDVNGNYEPSNCRWVTRKQNMNNTRKNRIVEYNGIKKTVSEWSDELNIPYKTLLPRLNNWDIEKSFTYQRH